MRFTRRFAPFLCMLFAAAPLMTQAAEVRLQARIAGSSTVYPFVATAAEQFGRGTAWRTPIVESTGTGGGIRLFCEGLAGDAPDMANASRRIKPSEEKLCRAHGVNAWLELPIGFDGIVLANQKGAPRFMLTLRQLFLALARVVPQNGKLVPNPYQTWQQVDATLPDIPIEVYGPPVTSGTRDAFAELVMERGCTMFKEFTVAYADEAKRKQACQILRDDGRYADAGENDNVIVQKLTADETALGIFGYSFLEENADKVQPSYIDGRLPTFDAIARGQYAISRSLYVYVKVQRLAQTPSLKPFLNELFSEAAAGEEGYMALKGLIPLPAEMRAKNRAAVEVLR